MRIVHILQGKANPATLNGVNRALHWMATYQARAGHQVEVWGLSKSMTPPPNEREYNLRIFPMTRLRVTLGRELKAALDDLEPSAWVHFHSVFIPEYPAIARRLKRRGMAYGITPHNGYAPGVFRKNPWKKHLYSALREAKYLRHAGWIQIVGQTEEQDIRRIAPSARMVRIPNGQHPIAARTKTLPADVERPLIVFCGRLHTQSKGLDFLLDGFAAYKSQGGGGELWLIGEGEDRAELERQAAAGGARESIHFLGLKMGEEKLDLVAGCDAFIHSSRWDVLPGACLEAAALSRPLVVSRETNLAEYVERCNSGLVLDETSAAGVVRALEHVERLYHERGLEALGANARQMVEDEFQWEKNASSFIAAIPASAPAV
ncbi:MAG: glycosyltransferase family 4 protein [Terracidiphilus sp.]|jgi:glycosyltransferase involved in cell wall biosynthesis